MPWRCSLAARARTAKAFKVLEVQLLWAAPYAYCAAATFLVALFAFGHCGHSPSRHYSDHRIGQRAAESEDNLARQLMQARYIEGEEIDQIWHSETIWWSYCISVFGAYVALTSSMFMKQVGKSGWYWLLLAQSGLALGVCCVWSMHFVGMFALQLQNQDKPQVIIKFEPAFTVVSAAAAWLISCIALHIILGHRRGISDNDEERRVVEALSFRKKVRWHLKGLPVKRLTVAALLVATGVCIMHYMGMLSQTGPFTMEWSVIPIFLSTLVAGAAASVGLPIFVTSFDSLKYRVLSSLGIGLFVNCMHYTGMQSATYYAAANRGIWGEGTYAWELNFKDVVAFTLILDLVLMGFTGYYVELAQECVKSEERFVEKKLAFESHKRNAKKLIGNSRILRYPMTLMRYDTFARLGKLLPHETLRDSHRLVYLNTVKDVQRLKRKYRIVYFSHEWLSSGMPDPANRHYRDMMAALQGLAQVFRVKIETFFVFVDYCSIPQESKDQQQLAIDSLCTYVSLSSAFVVISPQTVHATTGTLCNFASYSKRFWCRLEVFCTILASLRNKDLKHNTAHETLHEEPDEDDDHAPNPGLDRHAQHMFVVVEDSLHPLSLLSKQGALQPHYQELTRVYEGTCLCCEAGHKPDDESECDKLKVVDSLTGAYGAMLADMRKMRRNRMEFVNDAKFKLLEEIVKVRADIFPTEFFGSRIDAVHERLDNLAYANEADGMGKETGEPTGMGSARVPIDFEEQSDSSDSRSQGDATSETSSVQGSRLGEVDSLLKDPVDGRGDECPRGSQPTSRTHSAANSCSSPTASRRANPEDFREPLPQSRSSSHANPANAERDHEEQSSGMLDSSDAGHDEPSIRSVRGSVGTIQPGMSGRS